MNKNAYLAELYRLWSQCRACGLCEERRNVVFGYGQTDQVPLYDRNGTVITMGGLVMIVGEAPGENEDKSGLPFVGQAGMLLDQYLGCVSAREEVIEAWAKVTGTEKMSETQRNEWRIRLRDYLTQEFYFTNIVMCRPPENRDPSLKEIQACKTRLLEQIYTVDPVFVIAAGKLASETLIGKKFSILQARGELYDVEFQGRGVTYRYPVMPVLHPSYLLRKNDFKQGEGGDTYKTREDFKKLMHLVDEYCLKHYGIKRPPLRPKMGGK